MKTSAIEPLVVDAKTLESYVPNVEDDLQMVIFSSESPAKLALYFKNQQQGLFSDMIFGTRSKDNEKFKIIIKSNIKTFDVPVANESTPSDKEETIDDEPDNESKKEGGKQK